MSWLQPLEDIEHGAIEMAMFLPVGARGVHLDMRLGMDWATAAACGLTTCLPNSWGPLLLKARDVARRIDPRSVEEGLIEIAVCPFSELSHEHALFPTNAPRSHCRRVHAGDCDRAQEYGRKALVIACALTVIRPIPSRRYRVVAGAESAGHFGLRRDGAKHSCARDQCVWPNSLASLPPCRLKC